VTARALVRSWLLPTYGGSLASAWAVTTILGIFGPIDGLLGNRFWNWVASMIVSTVFALGLGTALVAADGACLRWRRLPVGWRAWWTSVIASLLVMAIYSVNRPGDYDGALFFAAMFGPMLVAAFVSRWVGGRAA
jgi:hypothetical protein